MFVFSVWGIVLADYAHIGGGKEVVVMQRGRDSSQTRGGSRKSTISGRIFWNSVLSGSLSPQHGAPSGCGWRNNLQLWRVAANTLNKQSQTADKGWSSSLGVGRGANKSSP
jgi:hypothetical protein